MTSSTQPPASNTSNERFGIAALQLDLEKSGNLERITTEIATIAKLMPWVRMVVIGELASFGANPAHAQPLPGPAESHFCRLASKHGLWLIPGSLYEKTEQGIFNTAPVIDPAGNVVARYRKQFPFYPYEKGIEPGDESVVFDVPGAGRFGISICYDMSFPETSRSLSCLGAEVILHPTLTWSIDRDVELAIARASAASNQCYFVDVNVAGNLGTGRSIVCGPGGEVIHQARSGREIITFEVDFNHVRHVRERGWHGLGQQLKSFRNSQMIFPAYGAGAAASQYLSTLGSLQVPGGGKKSTDC